MLTIPIPQFWSGILQAMTTEATNGNSQSLHSELVDLPKKLFDGILAALLKQAAVGALEVILKSALLLLLPEGTGCLWFLALVGKQVMCM